VSVCLCVLCFSECVCVSVFCVCVVCVLSVFCMYVLRVCVVCVCVCVCEERRSILNVDT
jgi:hypothetical protein